MSAVRPEQEGPAGPVLVAGATGYVGGRLVPALVDAGHAVRALGRSPDKVAARPWSGLPGVELAVADVSDPESLGQALRGCSAAFYLVHSMRRHGDFAAADREAAACFARAAAAEGVGRIIYLSGLEPPDPRTSEHLRSRAEVDRVLRQGPVPVTTLRAAQIIGSGSASFELLRYLGDRLPIMLTSRWVQTECQPISIRNVLGYLVGCLEHPETTGQVYDIGGPHIETYEGLFRIYREEAGLPRQVIVPLPLWTPRLGAFLASLVTPIPFSIVCPLIEGLRNRVVCSENRIRDIIPQELVDCRTAIRRAIAKIAQHAVDSTWADAGSVVMPEWARGGDAPYAGGTVLEYGYRIRMRAPVAEVWQPILDIGGENGWYYANTLWRLRGGLDTLVGGAGMGRSRPTLGLRAGDTLDFWRVVDVRHQDRLLLLAEMRMPGEGLLEFRICPLANGETQLVQRARFLPHGLWGITYWYATWPLHRYVFSGMLRAIAAKVGRTVTCGPEPLRLGEDPKGTACRYPRQGPGNDGV